MKQDSNIRSYDSALKWYNQHCCYLPLRFQFDHFQTVARPIFGNFFEISRSSLRNIKYILNLYGVMIEYQFWTDILYSQPNIEHAELFHRVDNTLTWEMSAVFAHLYLFVCKFPSEILTRSCMILV